MACCEQCNEAAIECGELCVRVSGIVGFSERTAECRQSAWYDGCVDRSCSVLEWALSGGLLCVSIVCLYSVSVLLMARLNCFPCVTAVFCLQ